MHKNQAPISSELLDKYLSGKCTLDEIQQVEAWYEARSGEKNYLSRLSDVEQRTLQANVFDNIRTKININTTIQPPKQQSIPPAITFFRFSRWITAACVLFLIGIVGWGYWAKSMSETGMLAETEFVLPDAIVANSIRFMNKEARIVTHLLPDGTKVWLHPQAAIQYPKTFKKESRHVVFEGEGFFEVFREENRPFYIQMDKMQVKVLGTSFTIKAVPRQAIFQVSVVTGSVAVKSITKNGASNPQAIILKPQQKAFFEVISNRLTMAEATPEGAKEIYEPISIRFTDTPIRKVIQQLNRQFDITIQVANEGLYKCQLTADFNQQSLPNILDMLCASLDATYTISGNTIMLSGAGCVE
jgi:transmembrane sensor